jgi:triosephosphate isomerase (TIM)
MQRRPSMLVVANWKMNPRTLADAKELFRDIKKISRHGGFVIAPPVPFLGELARIKGTTKIGLGAQDCSGETLGAHTGDIAASMLRSLGASYVIVGHSERRAQGESEETIRKKLGQVIKAGLTAIICVGEREREQSGRYFSVVEAQLRDALKGVPGSKLAQVVVAYEPVWAISTSTQNARAATPEDAHEMIIFIRKVLSDLYGRQKAAAVKILYGGSVDQKNVAALVLGAGAQGFLVGGASLRPRDFMTIVSTAHGG